MKLLFATGNEKKYQLMKERLKVFPNIEVIMPKQLNRKIEVEENGKTAEENAIIKAMAYHHAIHLPTIAEDSGLWVDKFAEEDQPGLFVKRIQGKEGASNRDILSFYLSQLKKVGGESLARYRTGIAVVNEQGKLFSTTVEEKPFLLTNKKSKRILQLVVYLILLVMIEKIKSILMNCQKRKEQIVMK